jgi:cell division protein FtsB
MQRFSFHPKQILIIGMIIIAVFLLLDYQSRMNQLYKVQTQRDIIVEEVVQLKQTEQALQEQLDFAGSPVMVEEFAREELKAGQPGDIRIVPISPYEVTPTPIPEVLPTPQEVHNWEVWKALFFE